MPDCQIAIDAARCSLDDSVRRASLAEREREAAEAEASADASDETMDSTKPLCLEWRRVNAWVQVSDSTEKQVLHGVDGRLDAGALVGILGPSGSGKTSLLALLGRRSTARVLGEIRVDERGLSKSTRRKMGYCSQDDTMWGTLTVQETLRFAAELRLPSAWPRERKLVAVDDVIDKLGLRHARHTIIGGALKRGVSGGERKRVAIALELLISPGLVLMDEPTSGLDSTTALRLCSTLRQLSKSTSCLLTVHQPSTRMLHQFDSIYVLSAGRVLYGGAPGDIASSLAPLGFVMPPAINPAEWILDLASGDASVGGPAARDRLVALYAGKGEPEEVASDILPYSVDAKEAAVSPPVAESSWPSTWWTQVKVLTRRNIASRAEGMFDVWRAGQSITVAIIGGVLWLNDGRGQATIAKADNLTSLLFFTLLFNVFASLFSALFAFPPERAIAIKERQGGWWRVSAYFIARSLADIPLDLALPALFVCIAYWMAGLRPAAFVPHLLAVALVVMVANSLGLLISALSSELKKAQAFASVLVLALMLCGGWYLSVPGWLRSWVRWISFINQGYSVLVKLQWPHEQYLACGDSSGGGSVTQTCSLRSSPRLNAIDWLTPAYINVLVLLAMLFALRLATYIALRFVLR